MTKCENWTYGPVSSFDGHTPIFSCFCVFGGYYQYKFKKHLIGKSESLGERTLTSEEDLRENHQSSSTKRHME